jgi:hypothetical protein
MFRSIALFSVLVCAGGNVAADEHKLIAMSEWSKPVESHDRFLQARWLLLEGRSRAYAGPGKEILLYVELQNANSAWGEPLRIFFNASEGLKFELLDADGKVVAPSGTGGSGGDVGAGWITLPHDSTLRLRANPGGWGTPRDAFLALPLRPMNGQYWLFREAPPSDLFLMGKLTIAPPTDDTFEHRDDWRGTIEFPKTKLLFKKP